MGRTDDGRQDHRIDYDRMADAAERLALTEGEAARTFARMAQEGGERAGQRQALAEAAQRQMERLRQWAAELRNRRAG